MANSEAGDSPRIAELEEENEALRTQLESEQKETARLRGRLEALEDKFVRLESFMSAPLSTAAPDPTASLPSPSSFSSFSDSIPPAPFEQPEYHDFKTTQDDHDTKVMSNDNDHDGTHLMPIDDRPTTGPVSDSAFDSSRLVAREVEDSSLPRKLSMPMNETRLPVRYRRSTKCRSHLLPLRRRRARHSSSCTSMTSLSSLHGASGHKARRPSHQKTFWDLCPPQPSSMTKSWQASFST